ncbi:hypothetical protein [Burkholderia sp. Bp9031]|uniref:hypothetical protein n=1 Tax=Burkholderia sp. Bp9031 TaxID=2184566 RepID=UPI000F5DEFBA|nr:hypothetical protein [Burkholderia sp. Bp9031]
MNNSADSGGCGDYDTLLEQYKQVKAENEALRAEVASCRNNIETRFSELAALTKLLEARNHQVFLATSACLSLEGKMSAILSSFSLRVARSISRTVKNLSNSKESANSAFYLKSLITKSSYFDTDWYVSHHPEVVESEIDPIQYFMNYGLTKWHDPGPDFSCDRYVDKYPDVAMSGIPPFLHFIRHGMLEGRNSK